MSAQVLLVYRVMPESVETSLEGLKNDIRGKLEPKYRVAKIDEEPIGFGITALKVYVQMEEREDRSSDEVEELLRSINGVGNIELEYFSRVGF